MGKDISNTVSDKVNKFYKIIKNVLDSQRPDTNLASDAAKEQLAIDIAEELEGSGPTVAHEDLKWLLQYAENIDRTVVNLFTDHLHENPESFLNCKHIPERWYRLVENTLKSRNLLANISKKSSKKSEISRKSIESKLKDIQDIVNEKPDISRVYSQKTARIRALAQNS